MIQHEFVTGDNGTGKAFVLMLLIEKHTNTQQLRKSVVVTTH